VIQDLRGFDFVFTSKKKWFSLSKKFEKYYLPEEDEPHRACKNKNYIPMLMFLCVSVRPEV
jgi:hypothetical protein